MKNKILLLSMLVPMMANANIDSKVTEKETLAKEIATDAANCYVAHKRAETDFYENGQADIYKKLIGQLVGDSNVNQTINIAYSKIEGHKVIGLDRDPKLWAKEYCTVIDQKLAALSNLK